MLASWKAALAILVVTAGSCRLPVPAEAKELADTAWTAKVSDVVEELGSRQGNLCPSFSSGWPGLDVSAGSVRRADLLREIEGYAGAGVATGGLGGQLRVVTTLGDYDPQKGESTIPGSLRALVDTARAADAPTWIVFDPKLGRGAHLKLKSTLRLPSNITIDGSCADVTLEAPDEVNTVLVYIANGARNVVVARLAMRKSGYVPELHPETNSAIRVNGDFDRIALVHNDLWNCGDGCIDVTVSPNRALPLRARITVAYNFVHDHDKVMLFGTLDCAQVDGDNHCDRNYFDQSRGMRPSLYLTLQGNVFLRTGQRHPRVFGRAYAHVANNVFAFQAQRHDDGKLGAAYGIFVSNTARALIEQNLFIPIPPGRVPPLAVWTVNTQGALRVPTDVEGFVRLGQNHAVGGAVLGEDGPSEVPNPEYALDVLSLARLPVAKAFACVVGRAGRGGASAWNLDICEK